MDLDLVSVAPVDLSSCPAAGDVWFALEQQPLLWTYMLWCFAVLGVVILYLGLESSFGGWILSWRG